MNQIRWVAWGVIDLEKLERMQRRNYIKKIRADVAPLGITFESGGTNKNPWYQFVLPTKDGKTVPKQAYGGQDAARKVCQWLLTELGDHERSEDGGVRRAGDEAQAGDHA